MHDIKAIRNDPEGFDEQLARRGLEPMAERLVELDQKVRGLIRKIEEGRARQKTLSKSIGAKIKNKEEVDPALREKVKDLRMDEEAWSQELQRLKAELQHDLFRIPNLLQADVPEGTSEGDNVVVATEDGIRIPIGTPKPHYDLTGFGLDFEGGARLAGSRFVAIRGEAAQLYKALSRYMLSMVRRFGYEEVVPPLLVNDQALLGTGQLPKFEDDLFKTTDGRWLIPTAEVSLTNLVQGQILPEEELPMRLTALTPCFRSEAGAAGRDTRGLIRQHQFDKVEMVSITTPEKSDDELERMTTIAESILDGLGLKYRRSLLCAGDTGFSSSKTYDLEVWMAGHGEFREISSCSNCLDFQARRMNTRYRSNDDIRFVHTLNGSALAVGRALAAVIESYQLPDGTVETPYILEGFFDAN